jgi:mitochondrial GTPase 1
MNVLASLPPAPSWFPGHMASFTRALPTLLAKTHIVLEVRDARLPLTSINPVLEEALVKWKVDRTRISGPGTFGICSERIVVYTKRDLVPSWGEEV